MRVAFDDAWVGAKGVGKLAEGSSAKVPVVSTAPMRALLRDGGIDTREENAGLGVGVVRRARGRERLLGEGRS
jgi:hypothetical protein